MTGTETTGDPTGKVCLKVQRCNPASQQPPYVQEYEVPVSHEKMSLLQALEYVYANLDDTLAFRRYCCGLQYCNSCIMSVNGKQTHACLFIVESGEVLEIAPAPGRDVLRDLVTESKEDEGESPEPV